MSLTLRYALTALLLPPVPMLLLAAFGAWQRRSRPRLGAVLVALALVMIWLSGCEAVGRRLELKLTRPPAPLLPADVAALRERVQAAPGKVAIVALGAGLNSQAPEFGGVDLGELAYPRMRYAARLARETGAALGFSGGQARRSADGRRIPAEADVAARFAREDFGLETRWIENRSTDTGENARYTVELLARDGVREIVVVTQAWHMRRALRAFETEAAAHAMRVTAAPTGAASNEDQDLLDWMPSNEGLLQVRLAVREAIGYAIGR